MPHISALKLSCIAIALALSGCATSGGAVARPSGVDLVIQPALEELPPQSLDAGDCATFFWSADPEHRFLVFENMTRGYAEVFVNGVVHGFDMPAREALYVAGDNYRRSFVDMERQLDIEVQGRIGDPLPTGQRIERVVMRVEQPDGQRLVAPLIGHYACR